MAGSTVAQLGQIIKDVYNRPTAIVFELKKRWTCPKHRAPVYHERAMVCPIEDCPDPDECPHADYVVVKEGCPLCREAEWEIVEPPVLKARIRYSMEEALSMSLLPSLLRGRD